MANSKTDINVIQSKIASTDVARSNLFAVAFTFPDTLTGQDINEGFSNPIATTINNVVQTANQRLTSGIGTGLGAVGKGVSFLQDLGIPKIPVEFSESDPTRIMFELKKLVYNKIDGSSNVFAVLPYDFLIGNNQELLRDMHIFVKEVSIPTYSSGAQDSKYEALSFGEANQRVSVTFLTPPGMEVYNTFYQWTTSAYDNYTKTLNYYDNYTCKKLTVETLGRDTEAGAKARWDFFEAYPANISGLSYDQGSNDTLQQFTVEFTMSSMQFVTGINSGSSVIDSALEAVRDIRQIRRVFD